MLKLTQLSLAVVLLCGTCATDTSAGVLKIRVVDATGSPIAARAHVNNADGPIPPGPDLESLSHRSWPHMEGYVYIDGELDLDVEPGTVSIVVGKGFEWIPQSLSFDVVEENEEIVISLERRFDLAADGWYSGDTHVHSIHIPSDYDITPEMVLRVARAEDLPMSWILDGSYEFTGGPHAVSTVKNILWFTSEWRNQVYGHAALLGLQSLMGEGCCEAPGPAFPMLSQVRESWSPGWNQAMVLAHPCNGGGFFDDDGWPAWGLGRELPVLAANGSLDALEVASHSNVDDWALDRWYGLLSSGLTVPPSAGTDTAINFYWNRPAGSYRVYVRTDEPTLSADRWVSELKSGHSFVTNYPLIPEFTVNDSMFGSRVTVPENDPEITIRFRVQSVVPLDRAEIVVGGIVRADFALPFIGGAIDEELEATLPLSRSDWVAVRAVGTTNLVHAASPDLLAHTAPVYVEIGDEPIGRGLAAREFVDWSDSLHIFLDQRGGWTDSFQEGDVRGRIDTATETYRAFFSQPPQAAELLLPVAGDSLDMALPITFTWRPGSDPDADDRLTYKVELRSGDLFSTAGDAGVDTSWVYEPSPGSPSGTYFWRVMAKDLANNAVGPLELWREFYLDPEAASTPVDSDDDAPGVGKPGMRLVVSPNPFRNLLTLTALGERTPQVWSVDVIDVYGRRVRSLSSRSGVAYWDGRDARGRPVPAGAYWVHGRKIEPVRVLRIP